MRIAVGGFQHETNTFAPFPATYADFAQADGWPAWPTDWVAQLARHLGIGRPRIVASAARLTGRANPPP